MCKLGMLKRVTIKRLSDEYMDRDAMVRKVRQPSTRMDTHSPSIGSSGLDNPSIFEDIKRKGEYGEVFCSTESRVQFPLMVEVISGISRNISITIYNIRSIRIKRANLLPILNGKNLL